VQLPGTASQPPAQAWRQQWQQWNLDLPRQHWTKQQPLLLLLLMLCLRGAWFLQQGKAEL
jgi:hypothetical protein